MGKLIIANWKMQLTHTESMHWLRSHLDSLEIALRGRQASLVICPSFTVLPCVPSSESISWGAQDCSAHELGAYTGDISARSLKELGCSYTLIGHSERRRAYHETDTIIAQKAKLLFAQGLEPCICIGETEENKKNVQSILEQQLTNLFDLQRPITIAYEPVWAIGTGRPASLATVKPALEYIRSFAQSRNIAVSLLYGGSVNEQTVHEFQSVVDGFLLGKAGIDAPLLKKIILSC
jgi:triosephosphate isomerase (TIM)